MIEAIKDFLGIMDDAQDYADKLASIAKKAKKALDILKRDGETIQKLINRTNDGTLPHETVAEYIDSLDRESGWMIDTLDDALRDLRDIRRKAENAGDMAKPALERIDKLEKELSAGIQEHSKLISAIEDFRRKFVRLNTASAKGAAVTFLSSLLGTIIGFGAIAAIGTDRIQEAAEDLTSWLKS